MIARDETKDFLDSDKDSYDLVVDVESKLVFTLDVVLSIYTTSFLALKKKTYTNSNLKKKKEKKQEVIPLH